MTVPAASGACCSLSLGDVWRFLAWQLLNASSVPEGKTRTRLQLTRADLSFPLSPWNANVSREQGRHETQGSMSVPPSTCVYTCRPLTSPSCRLSVSRWTEQAGRQNRMQRTMSPGAGEPSFPMPYPVWRTTRMGNTTLPVSHTSGKVMVFCVLVSQASKQ